MLDSDIAKRRNPRLRIFNFEIIYFTEVPAENAPLAKLVISRLHISLRRSLKVPRENWLVVVSGR